MITAYVLVNGKRYEAERKVIDYPHIPTLLLQPKATIKAVSLNCDLAAKKVGYLPGAGDSVAEALSEMGCTVTQLSGADLTDDKLEAFSTRSSPGLGHSTCAPICRTRPRMPWPPCATRCGRPSSSGYNRPDGHLDD